MKFNERIKLVVITLALIIICLPLAFVITLFTNPFLVVDWKNILSWVRRSLGTSWVVLHNSIFTSDLCGRTYPAKI